ncbi:MAG: metallophosphoesterase [Pseudomonadota bacterium]|nr:metallophosphoesterase [Pseudomonadota bacterium]
MARGVRVAFISDTHLSRHRGFFVANFVAVVRAVNALAPDLVIHGGDLSVDGVDTPDDLVFARAAHAHLDAPVHFLAGNHDVGEEPGFAQMDQPVAPATLARFRDLVGPDRWTLEAGDWLLAGLNSQLMGTGLADEAEQLDWLEGVLSGAGDRPVGVFLHKPVFFARGIAGGQPSAIFAPSGPRARLLARLLRARVRFVASGHLHKYLDIRVGPTRFLWAPATAYRSGLRVGSGVPLLGFMVLDLDDAGFLASVRVPHGIERPRLSDLKAGMAWLKDAPPLPAGAAERQVASLSK